MYKQMLGKISQVSDIMSILSHEKRLGMLCLISEKERNISELTDLLGISQSLTSQFALKMRDQGILKSRKEGKEVFYSLQETQILELIKALKTIYC